MQIPETEIIVTKDGAELSRKTVKPGDYIIGREPECDVQVEAELVSRRHAQLTVNYDHALIEDLGSSNGTFVNGRPVTESTRLWPNQKIQVGAATIELHRIKTVPPPDVSLAPQAAAIQRLLPEEFLRDKKYDIGKIVAQGGMGAILDAKDATTERRVAMKVMLDGSSPDDLIRFVSEAKVTAQLEHPSIVPVYELSVDENGQVFYTMKMVRGITLRKVLELLAEGVKETVKKYPLPALLTIFQKVCDALAFAHAKGVIHRDLKPENIMLDDFGVVLVMDWGLAKVIGQSEDPPANIARSAVRTLPPGTGSGTLAGTVMGTPQYMSPEQARGEVETLDARSDIYALGAILYHILALRPPVTGDDAWAIVAKVSRGEIEPLVKSGREAAPRVPKIPAGGAAARDQGTRGAASLPHLPGGRVPDSLAAVVRKAMAFDKAGRYPQIADLQRDIEAYQNGRATSAENASLGKQLALLVKRHKALFSTAFAAWLIITALAVWFVINIRASERKATHNAEIAAANEQRALAEKENTRQALAKSQIALAEGAYRERDSAGMRAALNEVPADLRDLDWRYLSAKSDMSVAAVENTDQLSGVAADPTTPGVFAVAQKNSKIALIKPSTGERLREFEIGFSGKHSGGNSFILAFSPDGERIAVGHYIYATRAGGVVLLNAHDGQKLAEWDTDACAQLTFSPNGSQLLLANRAGATGALQLYEVATGKLLWTYSPHVPPEGAHCYGAIFTPDGQQILVYGVSPSFRLLDAKDGAIVRDLKVIPDIKFIEAAAMLPGGKAVVAMSAWGEMRGLSLTDGSILFQNRTENRTDHTAQAYLTLMTDGKRFVSVAALDDGRQSIQLWDAAGGKLLEVLLGGAGEARGLSVNPLSDEMLVTGPATRLWNLKNTPPKWLFPLGYNSALFWGSDDLVLTPGYNHQAILWDLRGFKPIWQTAEQYYDHATISANGQFAAIRPQDIHSGNISSRVLRLVNGKPEPVAEIPPPTATGFLFGFSPDGSRLLLDSKGWRVFDAKTGEKQAELDMSGFSAAHDFGWVAEGKQIVGLVTAQGRRGGLHAIEQVVLWDAATGKRLQSITYPAAMDVLAVSPDGRSFAEAGADKLVRVRDAATLAIKQVFRAHDGPITVLAFHPSQPILATGSEDLTVKIWNLETGRTVEEFRGLAGTPFPKSLNFSPSGKRLAWREGESAPGIWEPASLNSPATPGGDERSRP